MKADPIVITHPHGNHWSAAELDKFVKPGTILIAPQEVVFFYSNKTFKNGYTFSVSPL